MLTVRCHQCQILMTPENAHLRPELFLCDRCLPATFRPPPPPPKPIELLRMTLERIAAMDQDDAMAAPHIAREALDQIPR